MWGAVGRSSELFKRGGAVQTSTARSSELLKVGGSVQISTVLSSELIEKGGFYAELYRARF